MNSAEDGATSRATGRTAAQKSDPSSAPGENSAKSSAEPRGVSADLLAALSGLDANRERAVAHRTRRVVHSSMGVLNERKQNKSRARALAIGVSAILLLLITPLIWEITDNFAAGEHLADPGSQLSLWACVLCATILAAALIVGWMRKNRS